MLLEQENEQLASEAAQLASQCAALQVESAEVGDELHSQQLLATRCHALAQRARLGATQAGSAQASQALWHLADGGAVTGVAGGLAEDDEDEDASGNRMLTEDEF